jgi:CMRF35-like protein 9
VVSGYDALKGPKEISGHEGETVSVKCTYGEELRKHMKYWCRQGGILFSRCTGTIYTKGDQEVTQGRVSIRDSPQELALTVTMRHLTLQDAGKYWCGVNMLGLDETSLISLIVFPGDKCLSFSCLGHRRQEGKKEGYQDIIHGSSSPHTFPPHRHLEDS